MKPIVPANRISNVQEYYFSVKLKEIARMANRYVGHKQRVPPMDFKGEEQYGFRDVLVGYSEWQCQGDLRQYPVQSKSFCYPGIYFWQPR